MSRVCRGRGSWVREALRMYLEDAVAAAEKYRGAVRAGREIRGGVPGTVSYDAGPLADAAEASGAEYAAVLRRKQECIDEMLRRAELPWREAQVMVYRYIFFWRWSEVAAQMQCSVRHAHRIKDAALDKLAPIFASAEVK